MDGVMVAGVTMAVPDTIAEAMADRTRHPTAADMPIVAEFQERIPVWQGGTVADSAVGIQPDSVADSMVVAAVVADSMAVAATGKQLRG